MKRTKLIFIIVIVILLFVLSYSVYPVIKNNSWGWISSEEALADLEECVNILESNHPLCRKGLPEKT